MGYQGVIFDLDGVLCSTDRYHYEAWKEIADKLGIYFDEKINRRLRGVSRLESLEIILENYDGTLSDGEKYALMEEKNEAYRKLLGRMSPKDVSDEVRQTLKELRSEGILLAIGSSSKNTPYILQLTGLKDLFDAVADGNCITHSKPNPEVFLKAAKMLGLSPHECIVVEDSRSGIDAALRGGFAAAGIGDAAEYGKTEYILKKFGDILGIPREV